MKIIRETAAFILILSISYYIARLFFMSLKILISLMILMSLYSLGNLANLSNLLYEELDLPLDEEDDVEL